jgi:hypothetical protein
LDQPAQRDLGERPSFARCNVGEYRVAQQAPTAEGAISGEDQTALAARRRELIPILRLSDLRLPNRGGRWT